MQVALWKDALANGFIAISYQSSPFLYFQSSRVEIRPSSPLPSASSDISRLAILGEIYKISQIYGLADLAVQFLREFLS